MHMTGMEQFNIQNRQSKNSNSNVFNRKQSNLDLTTRRKAPMSATRTHLPTQWLRVTSSPTNLIPEPPSWTSAVPRFLKFTPRAKVETLRASPKEMPLRTSDQMCQQDQGVTAELQTRPCISSASKATTTKTRSYRTNTNLRLTMAKKTIKTLCHKPWPCNSKYTNTWS
jgi:hypothetical protein